MENRPMARVRGLLSQIDLNRGRLRSERGRGQGSPFASFQSTNSRQQSRIVKAPEFDEMLRLLECPVCYETIVPPVNMCLHGHVICFSCIRKVKSCPLCRGQLGNIRNVFAEKVVGKCSLACRNSESGCKVVLLGDEIVGHEYCCKYRPLKCPQCEHYVEYNKFLEHIKESDDIPEHEGRKCRSGYEILDIDTAGVGRMAWDITWLRAFGHEFFGVLESDRNTWWFAIGYFGTPEDAQKFECEIIISNHDKEMLLKYKGPVYVLHGGMQEAVAKGECLATTKSAIKGLIRDGGIDVTFKVNIRDPLTFGDLSFDSTFPSTIESSGSTDSECVNEGFLGSDTDSDKQSKQKSTQENPSADIQACSNGRVETQPNESLPSPITLI